MQKTKIVFYKKKLSSIRQSTSEEDRLQAALDLGISYKTVERYLSGNPKKEATAKKLLDFLNKRISA